MQSHFNCHAGFVAKMMSGIERNPEDKLALLVDSYEHYMTASEVILPVDLEESAIFLTDASNVARIGYNIACENHDEEHMNYFLRKREAAIEKAIEYSEGYDKVHAKAHLEAALSASLIFSVSNDTESAEKLAKYCREFLRHYEANPHVIGIDIKTILRIKARLHLARAFLKAEEVRNMLRTWNTDSSQPL